MLEKASEKLALLAAVFIIAGIGFYLLYMQQQNQPAEQEPDIGLGASPFFEEGSQSSAGYAPIPGTCPDQPTQYDKDLCWQQQAQEEQGVASCGNIEELSIKVACIDGVARDSSNTKICEQQFADNEHFKYMCLIGIAAEEGEYSYCETMPEFYKKKCSSEVDQELGKTI